MGKESLKILILCLVAALCLGCFGYYVANSLVPDEPEMSTQPTTSTSTAPTGTQPTTETTVPTTETTVPTTETTVPTTEATEPTTEATQPTTEATQPTTEATQPTTEATQPTTEATQPPVEIDLSAKKAFVYDLTAEKYLYTFGELDAPVEPASITKLFSAYVALQYLSLDTVLTVGEEITWIGYNSSVAFLEQGYQLTVEMCIQAMIIPSGNDAAYVLAVNAGRAIAGNSKLSARSAYDAFVTEMNYQAWRMGMTGTTFVNPDGMNEPGHYTTMADMLLMAKLALETPVIADAAATETLDLVLVSGQPMRWKNSNQLLHESDKQFYCAEAIGLKTGSTSSAGKCLISAFRKGDRILLICVMGCPANEDRYIDTLALYDLFA